MDTVLKENEELRKTVSWFLEDGNRSKSQHEATLKATSLDLNSTSTFLKLLIKSAEKQSHSKANRFEKSLKLFSTYLFIISGRSAYQTLSANLPLPSVSTVLRSIRDTGNFVIEGEVDFKKLSDYLTKHNLPRVLWMSEDATGVTGRIQFDPTTNQVVGFVLPIGDNGFPVTQNYPATDANTIKSYFENEKASRLLYIIMMQPLAEKAPPYCISLFGTDNKFTSKDVVHRWDFVLQEAAKYNITILGTSSDGDTRLLKAMLYRMKMGDTCGEKFCKYFACFLLARGICVQDTVHIATKLRNRLLKTGIITSKTTTQKKLMLGQNEISVADLYSVIEELPKSQHLLCKTDLDIRDKMNYRSVEKIISSNVINILRRRQATATAYYLEMIQNCIMAYNDKDLIPSERIFKIWTAVFFFRGWKSLVTKTPTTKMDVFITSNAYLCVEINAHAIVNLVKILRENNTPQYFIPVLFSSQTCENFFRITRSMTSTNCTMVNYSILEILHRLKRLQVQNEILYSKHDMDGFQFPLKKHAEYNKVVNLPSDTAIIETIEKAKHHVTTMFQEMNLFLKDEDFLPQIKLVETLDKKTRNDRTTDCDLDRDNCSDTDLSENEFAKETQRA